MYSELASQALALMLRVSSAENRCAELKKEMETRTVIGLACGIIMAREHCTQSTAFTHLLDASRAQNRRLKDIARDVAQSPCPGSAPQTNFED